MSDHQVVDERPAGTPEGSTEVLKEISMKRSLFAAAAFLGAALLMPAAASAQNAYASGNVNMRSGPGTGYTAITVVPRGAPILVNGCSGSWCDVTWGNARGWVSQSYIASGGAPGPVYAQPAPVYVQPAPVYVQPTVRFGFGYRDDDRRRWDGRRDRDRWDRDRGDRWRDRDRGDGWRDRDDRSDRGDDDRDRREDRADRDDRRDRGGEGVPSWILRQDR
jgi:uncharacterized protein YraI